MKIIVQRVKEASCTVANEVVSSIENGFMCLVGFTHNDTLKEVEYCARKIANLRVFEDEDGKLNISLKDLGYAVLSISQFTVYADTKKGNRPSFVDAMRPETANELYLAFNEALEKHGIIVKTGVFQAHMEIALINDGPVTVIVEKEAS